MDLIEILVISVGISLNVYYVVMCFGSLLRTIEESRLLKTIGIFALWQVFAEVGAQFLVSIDGIEGFFSSKKTFAALLSVMILIVLGLSMIVKGIKDKPIEERLTQLKYSTIILSGIATGAYSAFAGAAFGLMKTPLLPVIVITSVVTAVFVIAGLYTGYMMGCEGKGRVHIVGGILLLCAAVLIILRYMAGLI